MNKIYLIGNVVHTPEVRTTNSGKNVCSFSIAVNRRKRADGTQETDFFSVQAWNALGDTCAKFLDKGRKVAVIGAMQSRKYEGRDGAQKTAWEVMADEVEFLTPKTEGSSQGNAAPQSAKPKTAEQQGFTNVEEEELPF